MSDDNSDEEDSLSNIDFSVISTAIQAGGSMVQQILNGVHYGTPEVRDLLYNQADFILECKVCRNLFRSIPNFVAHKRIYCQKSAQIPGDDSLGLTYIQDREETVVVEPVSPKPTDTSSRSPVKKTQRVSVGTDTNYRPKNTQSTSRKSIPVKHSGDIPVKHSGDRAQEQTTEQESTLKQLLTGTFKGTSSAYNMYTKLAEKMDAQKSSTSVSTISMTPISTNHNAAYITVKHAQDRTSVSGEKTEAAKSNTRDEREANNVASKSVTMETNKVASKPVTMETNRVPSKTVESQMNKNSTKTSLQKKLEQQNVNILKLRPVRSKVGAGQFKELMELGLLGQCDLSKFTCKICSTKYCGRKTLLQHMHIKHSGRKVKYPCTICNKTFFYIWGVTRHLQQSHNKSKAQIERLRSAIKANPIVCNEEVSSDEEVVEEEASSSSQEKSPTVTSSSSTSSATQPNKTSPIYGRSDIKLSKCDGCGKAFWKRSNYTEHIQQCRWLLPSPVLNKVAVGGKIQTRGKVNTQGLGLEGENSQMSDEKLSKNVNVATDSRLASELQKRSSRGASTSTEDNILRKPVTPKETVLNKNDKMDDSSNTNKSSSPSTNSDHQTRSRTKDSHYNEESTKNSVESKSMTRIHGTRSQMPDMKESEKSVSTSSGSFKVDSDHCTVLETKVKQVTSSGSKSDHLTRSQSKDIKEEVGKQVKADTVTETNLSLRTQQPQKDQKSRDKKGEDLNKESGKSNATVPQKDLRSRGKESETKITDTGDSNSDSDKSSLSVNDGSDDPAVNPRPSRQKINEQTVLLPKKPLVTTPIMAVKNLERSTASKSGFVPRFVVINKEPSKSTRCDDDESDQEMDEGEALSDKEPLENENNDHDDKTSKSQTKFSQQIPQTDKSERSLTTSPVKTSPTVGAVQRNKPPPVKGIQVSPTLIQTRRAASESKYMRTRFFDKRRESQVSPKSSPTKQGNPKQSTSSRESSADSQKPTDKSVLSKNSWESSRDRSVEKVTKKLDMDKTSENSKTLEDKRLSSERTGSRKQRFIADNLQNDRSRSRESSGESLRSRSSSFTGKSADKDGDHDASRQSIETRYKTRGRTSEQVSDDVKSKSDPGKIQNEENSKQTNSEEKSSEMRTSSRRSASSEKHLVEEKKASTTRGATRKSLSSQEEDSQSSRVPSKGDKHEKMNSSDKLDQSHDSSSHKRSSRLKEKQENKQTNDLKQENIKKQTKGDDSTYIIPENVLNQFMTDEVDGSMYIMDKKRSGSVSSQQSVDLEGRQTNTRSRQREEEQPYKQYKIFKLGNQNKDDSVTNKSQNIADTTAANAVEHNKTVVSIEEIWVQKEKGQPSEAVRSNRIVVTEDSPTEPRPTSWKGRGNKMYVVDSKAATQTRSRCLDFNRIDKLMDETACKCLQCDMSFTRVSNLRRHVIRHFGWQRYKCKLCKFSSFMKSECNTHLIRAHAIKLLSSSMGSMIIDLNKEASRVRSEKKQQTLKTKRAEVNQAQKKGGSWPKVYKGHKTRYSAKVSNAQSKIKTRSSRQDEQEEDSLKADQMQRKLIVKMPLSSPSSKRLENRTKLDVGKKTALPTSASTAVTTRLRSTEWDSRDENTESDKVSNEVEARQLRKRKRNYSDQDQQQSKDSDKHSEAIDQTEHVAAADSQPLPVQRSVSLDREAELFEEASDNINESYDIPSVSDYEISDSETVSSPPTAKMIPNLNTMMTALEEARAFKRRRSSRGRGRRISPPLRKIQKLGGTPGLDTSEGQDEINIADIKVEERAESSGAGEVSSSGLVDVSEFENSDIVMCVTSNDCNLEGVDDTDKTMEPNPESLDTAKHLGDSDSDVKSRSAGEVKGSLAVKRRLNVENVNNNSEVKSEDK